MQPCTHQHTHPAGIQRASLPVTPHSPPGMRLTFSSRLRIFHLPAGFDKKYLPCGHFLSGSSKEICFYEFCASGTATEPEMEVHMNVCLKKEEQM